MSNLLTRSLSGIVYVSLIVCSILFCGNWGFPALCCLFGVLAMVEYQSLCDEGRIPSGCILVWDSIGVLILASSPWLFLLLGKCADYFSAIGIPFMAFLIYLIFRFIFQLYIKSDARPLKSLIVSLSGQLYIGVPLGCASMVFLNGGESLALTMFIMIWLNDTGAFVVGSSLGRNRLFPRISPKKSWEGFFGGLLFCVLCAVVIKYCFKEWSPNLSIVSFCIYGLLVGIFATWGDLVESLIKRSVGVKDSGKIMPGHGGILDRIDSLLMVAPVTMVFILIVSFCK